MGKLAEIEDSVQLACKVGGPEDIHDALLTRILRETIAVHALVQLLIDPPDANLMPPTAWTVQSVGELQAELGYGSE